MALLKAEDLMFIIKQADKFWTGKSWSPEYPDALVFKNVGKAQRAAGKHVGAEVWLDYGLQTEAVVWTSPLAGALKLSYRYDPTKEKHEIPYPGSRDRATDLRAVSIAVCEELLSVWKSEKLLNSHIWNTHDLLISFVQEAIGVSVFINWSQVRSEELPGIQAWQNYCCDLFDSVKGHVIDCLHSEVRLLTPTLRGTTLGEFLEPTPVTGLGASDPLRSGRLLGSHRAS